MKVPLDNAARIAGTLTIRTFKDGKLIHQSEPMPNKVVSSAGYGRNVILRHLIGDDALPIAIDFAALGDDDTAATDGDTALGNEVVGDIPITSMGVIDNVATFDVFIADANLPDGSYDEFGLFSDGRIMVRIIIEPTYSKASGEDTLFTYTLTLTG